MFSNVLSLRLIQKKKKKKPSGEKKKRQKAFYILFLYFFPMSPLHTSKHVSWQTIAGEKVWTGPPSSFLHLNKVLTSRPSWDHLKGNIIKHSSLTKVRGRKEHFNPFRASCTTRENLIVVRRVSPPLGTPVHTANCTLVPSGI